MTRLRWAHPYGRLSWSDWRVWAFVTFILMAVAVVHSLHQALVLWWIGDTVTFQKTFARYLPAWLLRVPLVPLVWLLADRFRLDRHNWRRSGVVHLIASVILADIHLVLALWTFPFFQTLLGGAVEGPHRHQARRPGRVDEALRIRLRAGRPADRPAHAAGPPGAPHHVRSPIQGRPAG